MDKRYQVFVSSTYGDLMQERQEVMQALLELDCIPSGMELFPAADDDQWTLIKRVIDDCDYYMVIIAGRYGSIGPDGKSYTQMEYEYAVSKGKPVIAFLHADPGKIPSDKTDPQNTEVLKAFREIAQRKMCKPWTTPQELGSVVSRSIVKLIKERPGVGWVRADRLPDESAAQEILKLRNEVTELRAALEAQAHTPPPHTADLAQGEEVVSLQFRVNVENVYATKAFDFTWNTLLRVLGPILLSPSYEEGMKKAINEACRNRNSVAGRIEYMVDEDFQKVKVQFRALGYITQTALGTWVITPYGDSVLMKLASIPSGTAR